jgi:hypothetical protein
MMILSFSGAGKKNALKAPGSSQLKAAPPWPGAYIN